MENCSTGAAYLNNRPFDERACFDHLIIKVVHYSDPTVPQKTRPPVLGIWTATEWLKVMVLIPETVGACLGESGCRTFPECVPLSLPSILFAVSR